MKLKKTAGIVAVGTAAAAAAMIVGVSPAHADGKVIGADSKHAVQGEYVVLYEDGVDNSAAKSLAKDNGAKVTKTFKSINGAAIKASADEARALAGDDGVKMVQANLKHSVRGTQDNPPSWGQD
ncbi:MAG: S8 family serine peptidase, partial [Stackebrandtia sp.]